MNRADVWLGNDAPNPQQGNTEVRPMDAARLIDARPTHIVISRKAVGQNVDTQLPPQRVRVEIIQSIRGATDQVNTWMDVSQQHVVIIGYKNHPTIPDTDILRGDQFYAFGLMFEVKELVVTFPDRLLASADVSP